jgi:capsular exopolysaccharide synthesis family protein
MATELLERAEREATAQWDREPAEKRPSQPSIPIPIVPAVASNGDAHPVGRPETGQAHGGASAAVESNDLNLDDCQSLTLMDFPENRLVSVWNGDAPAAEAFRLLSVRLRHLRRERTLQKVLITSTIPQEGKSVVSANLACALASGTRQKVLLLEGDIRRPTLSKVFGLKAHPGICEWLSGRRSLMESVYHLQPADVWLLPAGNSPESPLELLQSRELPGAIARLSTIFDWIIIDSPPVLPLADTSVWTRLADGILLVARQGITQKRHLKRGIEGLEARKVIGAVLNASASSSDSEYYAYRRPDDDAK